MLNCITDTRLTAAKLTKPAADRQ